MASFASFQNEIQQLQAKNSYARDANSIRNGVAKIGVSGDKPGKASGSVQTIEHFDDGRTILVR